MYLANLIANRLLKYLLFKIRLDKFPHLISPPIPANKSAKYLVSSYVITSPPILCEIIVAWNSKLDLKPNFKQKKAR